MAEYPAFASAVLRKFKGGRFKERIGRKEGRVGLVLEIGGEINWNRKGFGQEVIRGILGEKGGGKNMNEATMSN